MKKSKLVHVTITTRVVVTDDLNDEQIAERAYPILIEALHNSYGEFIESVEDDTDNPFDPEYDGE